MSILELWQQNRELIEGKTVDQVLSFCGNGKLRNHNETSLEFRELLDNLPSFLLEKYSQECLLNPFKDSGLVLQDIINQIGTRVGFEVEYGLYRGNRGEVGFDGLWTAIDGHKIIVEVKTTDAYRINLDTIAAYRKKLIEQYGLDYGKSSILIIVGRQDTGDLEAQIRGSRHAWDIRLISVESMLKLLDLKESLDRTSTFNKINELLKPLEYTRVDNLIDIVFSTSEDRHYIEPEDENSSDENVELQTLDAIGNKSSPAHFHGSCIKRISKHLCATMIRQAKTLFVTSDNKVRVASIVSKKYVKKNSVSYWYAFRPSQKEFLENHETSYVAFGCGSEKDIVLIPYAEFGEFLAGLRQTEQEHRSYWHVDIFEKNGSFLLSPENEIETHSLFRYNIPIGGDHNEKEALHSRVQASDRERST